MAVFPVSMCRLVLIHKVHVYRIIGDFLIKLCVQMKQRLSVLLQPQNPGLGR